MRLARWLMTALLMLPLMELVVFIAVAAAIGFGPAFGLILLGSIAGMLLLRHAGGSHIARVRVAVAGGNFSTLAADTAGSFVLVSGVLLLIPGFITDVIGLVMLVGPLRRAAFALAGVRGVAAPRADGVVDLEPEQWHHVPDRELPDRRDDRDGH